MGLFDFIRSQFIEVIECTDFQPDMIMFQFPVDGNEIKMGAQLTVREGQAAVFMNEGVIADVFGPGRYTLSTQNLPLLTKLKSWKYGFNSPFKAEVYFVSTRQFPNQKWGTQKPVLMRDKEFGMIRLSAFGIYTFRVVKPDVFLREIMGTLSAYTTKDISHYLRRLIVAGLSDLIGETAIPIIDIVRNYDELGAAGREKLQPVFDRLGLSLPVLTVESVSLPEEVEKVIDQRTSMGVIGDVGQYTRFQAAGAIRDFAQNEGAGGLAGVGVGLGAGAQVGQVFASAMNAPAQQTSACAACGQPVPADARFCPHCGKNPRASGAACPHCGGQVIPGAKFCPSCGKPLAAVCPQCGAAVTGRFCPECGTPRPE